MKPEKIELYNTLHSKYGGVHGIIKDFIDDKISPTIAKEYFQLFLEYDNTVYPILQRYGFIAGNPYRTDEDEVEMHKLREELNNLNINPMWEPVKRKVRKS